MPNPMPEQSLPRSVDALKFCQQGVRVSGLLPVKELPRLSAELQANDGSVLADLVFGIDEQARKTMHGHLAGVLTMLCQRCLDEIPVHVMTDVAWALVWNDQQAAQLPRTLDPVLIEGQELDLYSIVEDELLLALPLVAVHEEGRCQPPAVASLAEPEVLQVEKKKNPFQVLAALKPVAKDTE